MTATRPPLLCVGDRVLWEKESEGVCRILRFGSCPAPETVPHDFSPVNTAVPGGG